ncbi:MAG: carbohydrate binding family 9 domain-containing protein [Planctomycetes bacterium]|nr:carbohydrate binding family 9 domain-containing protein [Planctomycetota bacterium]
MRQRLSILLAVMALGMASALGGQMETMRLYECTMTAQPPKIDGRLDDPCWQRAEETSGFVRTLTTEAGPPSVQTHFRILYDDRHLYIAVRCDEPHPENIKASVTDADNPSVCGDDCIEIFCHPDPESRDYFQFAVNARGTRYDGRGLDGSWNGQWQAATSVGKDAWFLECAIAFSSFSDCRGIWRFNMNREYRSTGKVEYHCWSNTFGAFHTPERFGYLVFAGPFGSLRRGYLIQAAGYARSTLEKQQTLQNQKREIQQMRAAVPLKVVAPFEKLLTELERDEQTLTQRYSQMKEPSLQDWEALDRGLDALIARNGRAYWNLKFHVLLND